MKAKVMLIKLIASIMLLTVLSILLANRSARRQLNAVVIDVTNRSTAGFLNDSVVQEVLVPTGDFGHIQTRQLSISGMEEALENNPYVANSEVYLAPDARLFASIEQEEPIARIHSPKEKYYLSKSLKKLPLSKRFSAPVILVSGAINENDWKGIQILINEVSSRKLLINQVIGVEKESENAFKIHLKDGNFQVDFGALRDVPEKLEKLEIFYKEYLPNVGLNHYSKVVLKYKNQIVAVK